MNCLLVVPPLNAELLRSVSFPLGLGYISAAMKGLASEGVKTFNLNLHHEKGDSVQAVLEAVRREKIEAVLVGGVNFDHGHIKRIIKAVKEYDPHIQVLAGGGIITNDPETAMRALPWADFGLIGEGDLSVPELCRALKDGRDPETVDGLILKKDGGLIRTPPRAEVMDLASLPWCDYEGLGFEKYLPGSTYRERDLDDIFKEIDSLVGQYQIEYLYVLDDLLARSLARLSEFCDRVKKYKFKG